MSTITSEVPGDSEFIYYGFLRGKDGSQTHLGLLTDSKTPITLSSDRVNTYFRNKGIGNPDLSKAGCDFQFEGKPRLMCPTTVNGASVGDRETSQLEIEMFCLEENSQSSRQRFRDIDLISGLNQAFSQPLSFPAVDTMGIYDSEDERLPVVLSDGRVLLPYSELAQTGLGGPRRRTYYLGGEVLRKIYDIIAIENLYDTPKGRYYIAALLDTVKARPEFLNTVLNKLSRIGLDVKDVRKKLDQRIDMAQSASTARVSQIADKLQFDNKSRDEATTLLNPELRIDFLKPENEPVVKELVSKLAAFPQPE